MDSKFGRSLSSALFTFIVGQGRKEITVHSAPLADLSPTLDSLMNGGMLEAKLRQADWSEVVEEDTFVRLCEYAYRGDYKPPRCVDRGATLDNPDANAESEEPARGHLTSAAKKKSKKGRVKRNHIRDDIPAPQPVEDAAADSIEEPAAAEPEPVPEEEEPYDSFNGHILPYREKSIWSRHLKDRFENLNQLYANAYNSALPLQKVEFAPKGNSDPQEDFAPVFLGHAKLYILADTYNIPSLAALVLQKLAITLGDFKLSEDNISNVIELVQFAYQHTRADDALRTLATTYVVSVLGQIGEISAFRELLAEGGDFVHDFWQSVWG
ncbi:hypothetical protein P170DRAFT_384105 [Aspergillus steynii IBT 23096]|uniref:BTB domain-containing protein n=1 Tax=Aspergillus steynii IBT 23096 TaxID=1392250 RepID=A0A2I2G8Y9_9EURO|nr:uncharacterized protein P170DRAFT_384105 [Aspergillus steynii IBT 23096]PLB49344.1 hypothetical protein P170DRAFT_384105 [Aspergillus steynii IBT 23096]